ASAKPLERPKLVNDGLPKGCGKGGTVIQQGVPTTGYQRGCRCDECRAAAVEYKRNLRKRKRAAEAKTAKTTRRRAAAKKTAAARPTADSHREGNHPPPPEHQDELAPTGTRHGREPVLSQTGFACPCGSFALGRGRVGSIDRGYSPIPPGGIGRSVDGNHQRRWQARPRQEEVGSDLDHRPRACSACALVSLRGVGRRSGALRRGDRGRNRPRSLHERSAPG